MNKADNSDDWLDELLARPARLTDNGFSKLVEINLQGRNRVRVMLFAIVAAVCLALLLLTFQVESLLVLGEQIGVYLLHSVDTYTSRESINLDSVITQPSTLILLVFVLLGASVAISTTLLD